MSLRPRAIDISKPLPVVHNDEEIVEDLSLHRTFAQLPTGMEAEEEGERHIQHIIKRGAARAEVPIPKVILVDDYEEMANRLKPFVRPPTYIRNRNERDYPDFPDYDLDSEDERFLATLNGPPGPQQRKVLDADRFEEIIDQFEMAAAEKDGAMPEVHEFGDMFELRVHHFKEVYLYWRRKRESLGHPLLMRFLKPPEPNDPDPYRAFRTRNDEQQFKRKGRKNDSSSMARMYQLKAHMERARILVELVRNRERTKLEYVRTLDQQWDALREELHLMATQQIPWPEQIAFNRRRKERQIELQSHAAAAAEGASRQRDGSGGAAAASDTPKRRRTTATVYYDSDQEEPSGVEWDSGDESEDESLCNPDWGPHRRQTKLEELKVVEQRSFESPSPPDFPPPPPLEDGQPPPFRYRARLGRGGRVVFDRRVGAPRASGIVSELESDREWNPRVHTVFDAFRDDDHPLAAGCADAQRLLQQFLALQQTAQSS